MSDWATANIALRHARDEMNEAKRLDAGASSRQPVTSPVRGDCGCEPGTFCRANAACPRAPVPVR